MSIKPNKNWPVLNTFDQDHMHHLAMPLGGIGTGTISIGGRGDLVDWEIMNRPDKGHRPRNSFFALFTQTADGDRDTRVLEAEAKPPLDSRRDGIAPYDAGLPRFETCQFAGAYPLAQIMLSDHRCPVDVRLEAFNPMIPADAEESGLPFVALRYVLKNKTRKTVTAAVAGHILNFIGQHSQPLSAPKQNRIRHRKAKSLDGLFFDSQGVNPNAEAFGTMALATTAPTGVTHRHAFIDIAFDGLLDFWDDFSDDGALGKPKLVRDKDLVTGALAVRKKLKPGEETDITFVLAWHFPNRFSWTQQDCCDSDREGCCPPAKPDGEVCYDKTGAMMLNGKRIPRVGNHYAQRFGDAWDVARHAAKTLKQNEEKTVAFVKAIADSDMLHVVKEAALTNSSILRTETCFRMESGHFAGWEGCSDKGGCCHGTCTHVWNYEHASAFLYGDLARTMREVDFLKGVNDEGVMAYRIDLPMDAPQQYDKTAADGTMGTLMRLYREWRLSGDDQWLQTLWPKAKLAMAFCWKEGSWDADQDGVMEGVQHNTMDVEYLGPNPLMSFWYLGALRACSEMARHLGDNAFADKCQNLYDHGSQWVDDNLFNGAYYQQIIQQPKKNDKVLHNLWLTEEDPKKKPVVNQVGEGCASDQMVGQVMANLCGLGHLTKPANIRKALTAIMKNNFIKDLGDWTNHFRVYAVAGESGLVNGSYPNGSRPMIPFKYWSEVWPGFEYSAAAHMLAEGKNRDAMKIAQAVRDRHDGQRRNAYNECECGHHYVRSMASWALLVAATGFDYDGRSATMTFKAADEKSQWFWSNGSAWGVVKQSPVKTGCRVELSVLGGKLKLKKLNLAGFGETTLTQERTLNTGDTLKQTLKPLGDMKFPSYAKVPC